MEPNIIFTGSIFPMDVKVFTKDGIPYLDYIGTSLGKMKIHIPQIGLEFNEACMGEEFVTGYGGKQMVKIAYNVIVKNNEWFSMDILEKEMTSEDLEKVLGYKVKIVDKKV